MNLEERVSELERQNRRLKTALISTIVFLALGVVSVAGSVALKSIQLRKAQYEAERDVAALVEAQRAAPPDDN